MLQNDPAQAYLTLLKRTLIDLIYADNELRIYYLIDCIRNGKKVDPSVLHSPVERLQSEYEELVKTKTEGQFYGEVNNFPHSMIGQKRLDNIQFCAEQIFQDGITGDFVETGVWNGGACIFMRGLQNIYNQRERKVWVCDSFEGLPVPTHHEDEGIDLSKGNFPMLAISQEAVMRNFSQYGLLDEGVKFLKGWFKDTLPNAPIEEIALLRLDGDLYESTMDAMKALYHKVPSGGYVIVDDYYAVKGCEKAVQDYLRENNAKAEIHQIDWTGVYWRKP
ncbi:TylF/MycF/NovP-related O-methyltransferase [Cerasicoccus fimbriatus]|uniref:TylF/MycF/NovP-related O-methyltransferase n=1 Tax=Cerasicoccus fimbriatus TaxID=3014554 RepID=UPI0022B496F0|nr:TylF/MycF/NovP-related O-methyltransferase [Cerasicoccus sp. TK19100]